MKKRFIIYFCLLYIGILYSPLTAAENGFRVRAFHIDCRTEVMTMPALHELAEQLAGKGINTILMEYEATFPFDLHATICNRHAYTRQEVTGFVAHCARLGIDVIPLQNCFGHCEYILRHDRYAHLREDTKEVSQVCPLKTDEVQQVFREIFREVVALHPSPYFHIGADETYLLGDCEKCSVVNKSKLFVDYIKAMYDIVVEMGKRPVIWADIILMHPEAVHELPNDLVFVDWNYGWAPDRFGKLETLFSTGAEVWGAPSLRSGPDNIYLTQWEKHFKNLATYLPFAREKGYQGIIETSWSTSGTYGFHYDTHWEVVNMQPIRLVYPMSGFNILIEAYSYAVNSRLPLDYQTFIKEYGQTRYGLSATESELFLTYFTHPQEEILKGGKDKNGTPVKEILRECIRLKQEFNTLTPKHNRDEFAHYSLMLDIRINYLQFKEIETVYESPAYHRSRAAELQARLQPVIEESLRINQEFIKLNKNYLKEEELTYITTTRHEKMNTLYEWLKSQQ
ncbi:MAG: family 20 glycosylhydrolase [Tannerellaceae bacterium]|nr:family 20 glycosylhydrolase [Tannerellaceae bacterium]